MTVISSRTQLTDVPMATVEELAAALGSDTEVTTRALDRFAISVDASHYLAVPQALARPRTAAQVGLAMALAVRAGWPITLRGGGSSLSGQAMAKGLALDVRRHFRDIEVLDNGARVRSQPGATVRQVNSRLARHRYKLGPDPASEIACTIGGMVANNSSGMTCGTTANTYRTVESMVIVLPSGTVVDTAAPDADALLRSAEPELVATLEQVRDQLRRPDMAADIARRWSIKNTMGYGMNSFIDFDEPVKILEHLMVGSEGTLGFVAEATFRTLPVRPKTATGFLLFNSMEAATDALPVLVNSGADVVELLDSASILAMGEDARSVLPANLEVTGQASLLVEYQGDTDDELADRSREGFARFADFDLYAEPEMTQDPARREQMWTMRRACTRSPGTGPGHRRPARGRGGADGAARQRLRELQVLFDKHNYEGAVIFGHAKDGNIHFLVTEDFDGPVSMKRYEDFTEDMGNWCSTGRAPEGRTRHRANHGAVRPAAVRRRAVPGHVAGQAVM